MRTRYAQAPSARHWASSASAASSTGLRGVPFASASATNRGLPPVDSCRSGHPERREVVVARAARAGRRVSGVQTARRVIAGDAAVRRRGRHDRAGEAGAASTQVAERGERLAGRRGAGRRGAGRVARARRGARRAPRAPRPRRTPRFGAPSASSGRICASAGSAPASSSTPASASRSAAASGTYGRCRSSSRAARPSDADPSSSRCELVEQPRLAEPRPRPRSGQREAAVEAAPDAVRSASSSAARPSRRTARPPALDVRARGSGAGAAADVLLPEDRRPRARASRRVGSRPSSSSSASRKRAVAGESLVLRPSAYSASISRALGALAEAVERRCGLGVRQRRGEIELCQRRVGRVETGAENAALVAAAQVEGPGA